MLRDAVAYLEELALDGEEARRRLPKRVERGSYEVLVVDDGSKDGTAEVALELAKELAGKWTEGGRSMRGVVRVVSLVRNRGKGGSVKHVRLDERCEGQGGHTGKLTQFLNLGRPARVGPSRSLRRRRRRLPLPRPRAPAGRAGPPRAVPNLRIYK